MGSSLKQKLTIGGKCPKNSKQGDEQAAPKKLNMPIYNKSIRPTISPNFYGYHVNFNDQRSEQKEDIFMNICG